LALGQLRATAIGAVVQKVDERSVQSRSWPRWRSSATRWRDLIERLQGDGAQVLARGLELYGRASDLCRFRLVIDSDDTRVAF